MSFRYAEVSDAALMAGMNHDLIRDEGHRNRMSVAELESRMRDWLVGEYRAVLFERNGSPAGYALFRDEPEFVYLRQFYVRPEFRRQGVGREAMSWLLANVWKNAKRVRLEVLIGNS